MVQGMEIFMIQDVRKPRETYILKQGTGSVQIFRNE